MRILSGLGTTPLDEFEVDTTESNILSACELVPDSQPENPDLLCMHP